MYKSETRFGPAAPVLVKDAVYQVANTTEVQVIHPGNRSENVMLDAGDYIAYRGTTGMKNDDPVVGFQFYHVDGRRFISVSADRLTDVLQVPN